MSIRAKFVTPFVAAALILAATSPAARADDRSFSSVVKYIEKHFNGERQGTFGAISFGRFFVKLIKPAGVKNFKVVAFKSVDYSQFARAGGVDFNAFVQSTVDPGWLPLVQYRSNRGKQWNYVYSRTEKDDVKFLVVTLQAKQAFVAQVKFNPDRLVAFMNDPSIMGISLKDKTDPPPATAKATSDQPGPAAPQSEVKPPQ